MSQDNPAITAANAGTVQLGDCTVNRLGYGAMRITGKGIWGPPADRNAAFKTLRRVVELGVNFIDTADSYGPNVSEELIAEELTPYPPGLVIGTKGGWERVGPGQWIHNASPKHLQAAVEGSLKRLRLHRIDLYQLHIPDPAVSFDASMETLAGLQEQGKIRHIGLDEVTPAEIEDAEKIVPIVTVQNRYSLADRRHEETLTWCERRGIGFMPWYPFAGGKMLKPDHPGVPTDRSWSVGWQPAAQALSRIAARHGATLPQLSLAWLLHRSPVLLPIPGTSKVAHLEENVAAAQLHLTAEDWAEVESAAKSVT